MDKFLWQIIIFRKSSRKVFVVFERALYLAVFTRADCVLRCYRATAIHIEEVGEVLTKSRLVNTGLAGKNLGLTHRRNFEDTATNRGLIGSLIVSIPLLIHTIKGDNIPFPLCQLTNTLTRGAIAIEVCIAIRLTHHSKALGINRKAIHPFDFYIRGIGISQGLLGNKRCRVYQEKSEVILMAIESAHSQSIVYRRKLNTRDVALLVNGERHGAYYLLIHIVDMQRYGRIFLSGLGVFVGVLSRVKAISIDRHAVSRHLRLIEANECQIATILAPCEQFRAIEFLLVDPIGSPVDYFIALAIGCYLHLAVVVELANEDVIISHKSHHAPIGTEGGDHQLAGAEGLKLLTTHVVVISRRARRTAINPLPFRHNQDMMTTRRYLIIVNFLRSLKVAILANGTRR